MMDDEYHGEANEYTPEELEAMWPRLCGCGHRVGIHEYPGRCMGAVSWPDDNVTRCECLHGYTYRQIVTDRERFASESHDA